MPGHGCYLCTRTGPFSEDKSHSTHPNDFIDNHYPKVVAEILDAHPNHPFKYDAILIDEGQDFPVHWFQILARCLESDGEILIVRDAYQNVYEKDISWSDAQNTSIPGLREGRKFSGPWAELKDTWRMSPTITGGVSQFANQVLGAPTFNVARDRADQRELYPGSTFCHWENLEEHELDARILQVVDEVTRMATPSHPSDFAILTYTNDSAWHVVEILSAVGYPAVHVYDKDGKRDKNQFIRFRKGDGRLKVCTGHSFKGFEIWGVILLVSPRKATVQNGRWIYTSMGRAIEGLWVLNMDPALNSVANWFPDE